MVRRSITVTTPDGVAPAYEVSPEGKPGERRPAVLFLMDGLGVRDALRAIADDIANAGYHVLLPTLFHRKGPDIHLDPKEVFASPERIAELRALIGDLTPEQMLRDVDAFLAYLASRDDVDGSRIGTLGLCMGGRLAFLSAARFPDRVRAAVAIHPGGLVTDKPDSPHLEASKVKARLYIAGASEDPSFTDDQRRALAEVLEGAGVRFEMERASARHGFAPSDTPVHDPAEARRVMGRALSIFGEELQSRAGRASP